MMTPQSYPVEEHYPTFNRNPPKSSYSTARIPFPMEKHCSTFIRNPPKVVLLYFAEEHYSTFTVDALPFCLS
jgi:hypothetical protein